MKRIEESVEKLAFAEPWSITDGSSGKEERVESYVPEKRFRMRDCDPLRACGQTTVVVGFRSQGLRACGQKMSTRPDDTQTRLDQMTPT
ncbi:hypothetical protein KFK09_007702 [Dendrobium nobile]|uniref:Uncharacterized protein n=1 Tax=Dendrobium nobile TaxID=94219 RepID=A0A8T3BX93_DENNO|nr:hypothetical protein KFK09_007702 [Dendrobium nobile]